MKAIGDTQQVSFGYYLGAMVENNRRASIDLGIDKQVLLQALREVGVVTLGQFTLKSGQTSSVYINLRLLVAYPWLLRKVAWVMANIVVDLSPQLLCGVPYAALPIATCLAVDQNIPMLLWRKEAKDYGTKKQLEGIFLPGQICLMIEDVITTGSSLLDVITSLEASHLVIKDVLTLVDRQQGGKEHLNSKGYRLHSIFTLKEMLNFFSEK